MLEPLYVDPFSLQQQQVVMTSLPSTCLEKVYVLILSLSTLPEAGTEGHSPGGIAQQLKAQI